MISFPSIYKIILAVGTCGLFLQPVPGFALTSHARLVACTKLQKAIETDLKEYLHKRGVIEHISAASASVRFHDCSKSINAVAGVTTFDGNTPISTSSMFQAGSITKSFTATIMLQLEAEGRLSINDHLGKWLPQYPKWSRVTIRKLLNMTSGIQSYDQQQTFQSAYAEAPMTDYTPAQLVAFVKGSALKSGWIYSNTNYELAQMIIERATHHSYAYEVKHRFIDPLELRHTFYNGGIAPAAITDRMPAGYFVGTGKDNVGYKALYGRDVRNFSLSWAQAAGGIISTPADLVKWVRALYQGRLLNIAQRKELFSIVSDNSGKPINATSALNPSGYGLGIGQSYSGKNVGIIWYYEGETLGYRMIYVFFPKKDIVIAVGLNSAPNHTKDGINILLQSIYDTLKANKSM